MLIIKPTVIFSSIILITGALTIITDLKSKKIYNIHLLVGTCLGVSALIYTGIFNHEDNLYHLYNGLIAFIIGAYFHHLNLWRGGDAKLFTLYAFLMPALEPNHLLLASPVNLFACSFIAGAITLTPVFIKDIGSNYTTIIHKLSPKVRKDMFTEIKMMIFFYWILFPVYYYIKIIQLPLIYLAITYLMFYIVHRFLRKILKINLFIAVSGIVFGFFMHLWLDPNSLSWLILTYSIFKIGLLYCIFAGIYISFELLGKYKDRIPFAPILFMGCVLSYTPFLTWIINLMQLIR